MYEPENDPFDSLCKAYGKSGVVLGLGAGVSRGCGLPDWSELLTRIARMQEGEPGAVLVSALRAKGYSLGMIAAVLEVRIGKPRFAEAVRDALYGQGFEFYRQSLEGARRSALTVFVQSKNTTLASVAAFCASAEGSTFAPNPWVQGIANMNFDALLTRYSKARYGESLLRTRERPSAGRSSRRIQMYHVHGFLEFDARYIGDPEAEAPDIRVLTEEDFFDFFNAPNAIFNYTFLYLLREFPMVFIGMSLQDENVRRLLHYSAQETYTSMMKEGRTACEATKKMVRHFTMQQRDAPDVDRAVEQSLERLGVRVIWYSNHAEVPELLGAVYESAGQRWRDVYP